MEEIKVAQYGEKSVYFEQNTGQITIHSNGEVKIINPSSSEGMDLLRQELGAGISEILAAIKKFALVNAVPHQLTTPGAAVPEGFIGRERELDDIHQRLHAGGNALALVNAEGGMGKTTLAAAYWKRFSGEYQHLAWLFCEKGILEAMRSYLPEPLGLREKMNEVAADTDKQMRLIISSMANLPKNCLLVLDNANDPAHIQGFERDCAGLGWHVLITSRCVSKPCQLRKTRSCGNLANGVFRLPPTAK